VALSDRGFRLHKQDRREGRQQMNTRLKAREVEALTFMHRGYRSAGVGHGFRSMRPPRMVLGIGVGAGFLTVVAWFLCHF
jgi:hypothetical protein